MPDLRSDVRAQLMQCDRLYLLGRRWWLMCEEVRRVFRPGQLTSELDQCSAVQSGM